jgi:hypothetical protein
LTITQNTQLQSQNQGKKKYQPPQNYKQRFRTHKSNKKIKTTILIITHTTKSTNRIKEQKRKKNCIFHTQTTIEAQGVKKISSAASPVVGVVGSGEFK